MKEVTTMTKSYHTFGALEFRQDLGKEPGRFRWGWDRLDALWWALVFAWGGLVLILDSTGVHDDFGWWNGSGVFWIGVGSLALIGILVRLAVPRYRSKLGWTLFWGSLFLSLGLGEIVGRAWHALPLVAIAGLILAGTLNAGRRGENQPSERRDGRIHDHTG
jgi:hypothetical protein